MEKRAKMAETVPLEFGGRRLMERMRRINNGAASCIILFFGICERIGFSIKDRPLQSDRCENNLSVHKHDR